MKKKQGEKYIIADRMNKKDREREELLAKTDNF